MLKFIIDGPSVPKQSMHYRKIKTKDGREFISQYTPTNMVNYAKLVKKSFIAKYPNHLPSVFQDKPIAMSIEIHMEIPKSFSKTKREKALKKEIRPTVKPDVDNVMKNICDALNGVAYPDDKQICDNRGQKIYDEHSYVIVRLGAFEDE